MWQHHGHAVVRRPPRAPRPRRGRAATAPACEQLEPRILCHADPILSHEEIGGGTSVVAHANGAIYLAGHGSVSGGTSRAIVACYDRQGTALWAHTLEVRGKGFDHALAVDQSGNAYLTGNFVGHADFDPGPGVYELYAGNGQDAFVLKLSAAGELVWARALGGTSAGRAIAVDGQGNLYVAGDFRKPLQVDAAPDPFTLAGARGWDAFLVKLDADGQVQWGATVAGRHQSYGRGLALDDSGNPFVAGSFNRSVEVHAGAATVRLDSAGSFDGCLAAFSADGELRWAGAIGGRRRDSIQDLAVLAGGAVVATGQFGRQADFDLFGDTAPRSASGRHDELFLARYQSDGRLAALTTIRTSGAASIQGLDVDRQGHVVVDGLMYRSLSIDTGGAALDLAPAGRHQDTFLARFAPDGALAWALAIGGKDFDYLWDLSVGPDGTIHALGDYLDDCPDLDPQAGQFRLPGDGGTFVVALSADGLFVSAFRV